MKKCFSALGWLDAISIFVLWMLAWREVTMFMALGHFSLDLQGATETESRDNPNSRFVWELAIKSFISVLLIIGYSLLRGIIFLKRQCSKGKKKADEND